MLIVLCRTPVSAQDCQKGSGGVPADNYSPHIGRTMMFSSRTKPPYAANFHSEGCRSCNDTSGKSARLSLRASNIASSSELDHSQPAPGAMERSARDPARMDLELLLNLVRSEIRPTSEASSRHPSRIANAKPFSDASVQMQTPWHRRVQSLRKKHRSPTKCSLLHTHS